MTAFPKTNATEINAASNPAMRNAEDHACEQDCTLSLPSDYGMTTFKNVITGDRHMNQAYGGSACDGDTVWFCCCCRDGPHGAWQNVCTNCGTAQCGSCIFESV